MEQAARRRFAYQQTAPNATSSQQHSISQHQLDSKRGPAYFDDNETSVLDPAILEPDIMQSPNHQNMHFRKDSFANSSGVISPPDSHSWDPQFGSGLPIEQSSAGHPNHFHDDNNGFVRHHSVPQVPAYHHQHPPPNAAWPIPQGSGHCTPAGNVEIVPHPPNFDGAPFMHHRQDSAHGRYGQHPQTLAFNAPGPEQGFIAAPQVQTPMSPHSHQDWMGMAQQEMEGRPLPKRMRPNSPPRTMVDFQRRDGIRKKNGRIDIPQERNIHTIDDLIERTKDEDMLKELKQQKRLLRNREAALASRQRKKKHTEDLEGREKSFSTQVSDLERALADLRLERDSLAHDRQILVHRQQEAERVIDSMHMEKRDMIMKHTEETSSLRKKVQVLMDQLDAGPIAMSANPSSTGFTDFNAEMEALSMGSHEWDFTFVNDLNNGHSDEFSFDPQVTMEPVKRTPVVEKKASTSTIVPNKAADNASEQPVASGLLFMLLLCGAFVASRPTIAFSSDLPITPDVRAAAPAVLSNLLEAGVSSAHQQARNIAKNYAEPMPSAVPQVNSHTGSRMDQLQSRITSPTRQQEIDSAFSLTTAQYAALTNDEYSDYNEQPHGIAAQQSQQPQRTLAESLAHMQPPNSGSKAEVYTRSLLFDQIPSDVVKQFRDMVRERERLTSQDQLRCQDQQFYKLEG